MAHRPSCKSRRVSFFFLDQMKLNFYVYMVTTRMMTLVSKMMLMTMTMVTVGHRYEYTRSNDRMWRKNTVGFVTMMTIFCSFCNYFISKSNTNSNINFCLKFPFQVANPGSTCIGVDLNRNFPEG